MRSGAQQVVGLHSAPMIWPKGESIDAFCAELARAPLDRNASPLFSAHQMGSCRMGSNADAAVCDENGKVFGVRGLYIGDAARSRSSGVNRDHDHGAGTSCAAHEGVELLTNERVH
jgi:choline dehydrogenase-like flavoprotein